jgi:hypothetical protein
MHLCYNFVVYDQKNLQKYQKMNVNKKYLDIVLSIILANESTNIFDKNINKCISFTIGCYKMMGATFYFFEG